MVHTTSGEKIWYDIDNPMRTGIAWIKQTKNEKENRNMKAQILKMTERQGVGKKSGKPFNGYFVSMLYIDNNGELECDRIYVDKSACASALPADTMVDVVTTFPTGSIARLDILPHEQPLVLRG